MRKNKLKKLILLILIAAAITGYSFFFKAFLDPQLYLDIAWANVPYDPYIRNWDQPDFELLWKQGRPVVHFTFHSDRKTAARPTQVFIDALTKDVITEGIPVDSP